MEDNKIESTEPVLSEQETVEAVRKQVEYYFSKENLQSDTFLSSQMDANMSVPIATVMKFAKMKALTTDETVLRKALENSPTLTIIDNKIKATIKSVGRSTIILREIPSDAPADEVKEIFNFPGAKAISNLRSEIGDTWFVNLETEEDAKDTLLDLRMKKRTFRGTSVKARLKTETVVRSFFPVQPGAMPVAPIFPVLPYGQLPMGPGGMPLPIPYGFMGAPGVMLPGAMGGINPALLLQQQQQAQLAAVEASSNGAEASADAATNSSEGAANAANQKGDAKTGAAQKSGAGAKGGKAVNGAAPQTGSNQQRNNNTSGNAAGARGGVNAKGGKTDGRGKNESTQEKAPTIEINAANFPPLGSAEDAGAIPTPGFKGAYIKYSPDEIINIVKNVKEAKLPEGVDVDAHSLAVTAEPNKDLLKRQRTFSIDETREQLRQGRPVTRDAILPGKVDSRTLLYGDSENATTQKAVDAPAAPQSTPVTAANHKTETPQSSQRKSSGSSTQAAQLSDAVSRINVQDHHQSTPAKVIAPSTWAAMVKTNAEVQAAAAAAAATPATTAKAAPSSAKKVDPKKASSATPAKKDAAAPVKDGEAGASKEGEQAGGRRRKGSEGKENNKESDNKSKENKGEGRRSRNKDAEGAEKVRKHC